MNVLSLFNGMSFGMMALETLDIKVDKYYSSEIDKYANQATKALFPDIIQLGDVTKWREWDIDFSCIDLLLAGFPCQAWSIAGKQKGDSDPRGALVHDLIDIWQEIKRSNPNVKYMFENVRMKKGFLDYINNLFGVEPILINSALVSAQNRNRYYWTNINGVNQPEDKGIVLANIIEESVVDRNKSYWEGGNLKGYFEKRRRKLIFFIGRGNNPRGFRALDGKAPTLSTNSWQHNNFLADVSGYRKLTPRECFRLQTVPEHHIDTLLNSGISNTQLYKMCGNGWTHDVITHIFKGI